MAPTVRPSTVFAQNVDVKSWSIRFLNRRGRKRRDASAPRRIRPEPGSGLLRLHLGGVAEERELSGLDLEQEDLLGRDLAVRLELNGLGDALVVDRLQVVVDVGRLGLARLDGVQVDVR